MKRLLTWLLIGLCLILPVLAQEAPQWFETQGVLRLADKGEALLTLSPDKEGDIRVSARGALSGEDIPLYAMVWTLEGMAFDGVTDERAARGGLDALFSWYPAPQFVLREEGLSLLSPLPVVLKEGVWNQAAVTLTMGESAGETHTLPELRAQAPYTPPVSQPYMGYVTIETSCNVRSQASATSERVARVGEKTVLPCLGEKDNWYHVQLLDGSQGYVSKNLSRLDALPGLQEARQQILKNELTGAQRSLEVLGSPFAAATTQQLAAWNQAQSLLRQGKYPQAREGFLALGAFGGAERLAEELKDIQPFPKSGVLTQRKQGGDCEILIKAPREGNAYYVKITPAGEDAPLVTLFIHPLERARVKVPAGGYQFSYATGSVWQGEEKAFGPGGTYAKTREDIAFPAPGYRATLILSPLAEEINMPHDRLEAEGF